jgi:heme-degrading monooxygenase HmoA
MAVDPYIVIWEFTVPPEHTPAFIAAYGPAGAWARFFRSAPGYRGSELYRDREFPDRFVTIDFWMSPEDWAGFRARHAAEYTALDQACEQFTAAERRIGSFGLADRGQGAL